MLRQQWPARLQDHKSAPNWGVWRGGAREYSKYNLCCTNILLMEMLVRYLQIVLIFVMMHKFSAILYFCTFVLNLIKIIDEKNKTIIPLVHY